MVGATLSITLYGMLFAKIITTVIKVFYLTGLVTSTYLLSWLLKSRRKKSHGIITLAEFNQASQEEKGRMYVEWCRANNIEGRRCSVEELDAYATSIQLPTFNDWKEIYGYSRLDWVSRDLYLRWVKFIGAYNPIFDPDHPEWNGQ